jgi:hypothetical protein
MDHSLSRRSFQGLPENFYNFTTFLSSLKQAKLYYFEVRRQHYFSFTLDMINVTKITKNICQKTSDFKQQKSFRLLKLERSLCYVMMGPLKEPSAGR